MTPTHELVRSLIAEGHAPERIASRLGIKPADVIRLNEDMVRAEAAAVIDLPLPAKSRKPTKPRPENKISPLMMRVLSVIKRSKVPFLSAEEVGARLGIPAPLARDYCNQLALRGYVERIDGVRPLCWRLKSP
ncbi:MAG: hypothetical protein ACKVS5_02690 [Parvularculaceae bacterium]